MTQDGNGEVNWRELLLAVGMRTSQVPAEELFSLAFEILDVNSTNSIEKEELKLVLEKMSQYRSDVEAAVRWPSFVGFLFRARSKTLSLSLSLSLTLSLSRFHHAEIVLAALTIVTCWCTPSC